MIEIKNLKKTFEDKEVLKGINCTFHSGEVNLVIGRSGAGKTVFMKSMIGLIAPTEGSIDYDGRNIVQMNKKTLRMLRREMGMLFQGSALFDSMNVFENVLFPMQLFSPLSRSDQKQRVKALLRRVGLEDAGRKYPSEISGGMMKRTAIARAISLNPKYLFCDEPNSGLDPNSSLSIDKLIMEITHEENITTIVNTHDMNSVRSIGDKIVYLLHGELNWEGSSRTLESDGTPEVKMFINASELPV